MSQACVPAVNLLTQVFLSTAYDFDGLLVGAELGDHKLGVGQLAARDQDVLSEHVRLEVEHVGNLRVLMQLGDVE